MVAEQPQEQSNNQMGAGKKPLGQSTVSQNEPPANTVHDPPIPATQSVSSLQAPQNLPVKSAQPTTPVPETANAQPLETPAQAPAQAPAQVSAEQTPVSPSAPEVQTGSGPESQPGEPPQSKELRGSSSDIKKQREIIKAEEKDVKIGSRLGDLIIPFLTLGVLIIIVVFIFIPFGTEVMETRDQTKSLKEEIKRNEAKIDTLGGINLTGLEEKLDNVSVVVRDTMDVSEMAIEVEQLALGNSLVPLDQSATNTEDVVSSSSTVDYDWVPSYAQAISGPFTYKGEFLNLTAFLNDLRNNTKTILSMGSVSVSRSPTSDDDDPDKEYWTINLLISGYTAEPAQTVNIADPVRTDIDENLYNEIEKRVGAPTTDEDTEEAEAETENGDEE